MSAKKNKKVEVTWNHVKDKLPKNKQTVIVKVRNADRKNCVFMIAMRISKRSVLAEDFYHDSWEDCGDYDEINDCYWAAEGFYERTHASETDWFVTEEVTHWMYLPEYQVEFFEEV
jgi:hypothetical protein